MSAFVTLKLTPKQFDELRASVQRDLDYVSRIALTGKESSGAPVPRDLMARKFALEELLEQVLA